MASKPPDFFATPVKAGQPIMRNGMANGIASMSEALRNIEVVGRSEVAAYEIDARAEWAGGKRLRITVTLKAKSTT